MQRVKIIVVPALGVIFPITLMFPIKDIDFLLCGPDLPIRDVLARINASSVHLFQLVVDEERNLLGTITDGDVRRAILCGVTLNDPARKCMYHTPRTGRPGDDTGNLPLLREAKFLPILDDDGRLLEILAIEKPSDVFANALVMAGGYGRRLGARTKDVPKPLLRVGRRPILDRILEQLEDAGCKNIYIAVHFLAEKIENFVEQRQNRACIHFIREKEPLGTAGALGLLPLSIRDEIVLVNGDVVTRVDYRALREFHLTRDLDATIGVSRYDLRIPYGVVSHDDQGLFQGIREKPTLSQFVAAGMYYLGAPFLAQVPQGRAIDMPDMLDLGHRAGLRIGVFPVHEYWIDVGRPDDLEAAESDHAGHDARARDEAPIAVPVPVRKGR
ncbi:MAG: sugar phosphate nucleotidyltransferase [Proteobacteria bacterium]|nr:sugar phosphate nucleotidyltransferase [Pseudomonadota bacterium]